MQLGLRKTLDGGFTGAGILSIALMTASLAILLVPIFVRGCGAFVFRGTVEFRRLMIEKFGHGDAAAVEMEVAQTRRAREPVYDMIARFEKEVSSMSRAERTDYRKKLADLKEQVAVLLGPSPGELRPVMPRKQYGQTRWDRAQVKLNDLLYVEQYDYSDASQMGRKVMVPRADDFKGTSLASLFPYVVSNAEAMLQPEWTFYWRFLFDDQLDAHLFGGIWAEVLGTFYLTVGAILFGVPIGVISAIYLVEYASDNWFVSILRTCISTLAGVPSIVFGLFGLAFFINAIHVSPSRSVLAGSLTLAVLILPLIIRASEEAIRAVPTTYKEAALSLGAGRWRTVMTVILPAALPGILTGIVISMGRAAGETAPIIFTAAVSTGKPLDLWQTLTEGTPALPWNIYNLCTEHAAVDEIRHVQFGMVMTLVLMVLLLNVAAILIRARVSKKLKG